MLLAGQLLVSSFCPRRTGLPFFLDEESKQRNQDRTMLLPAWPARSSPFCLAPPHGISQMADALIDWFWPINNDPLPTHTPHCAQPSNPEPRPGRLHSRRFLVRRIHQPAGENRL